MEVAGAHVVGITCDGASTNRTMWNSLGVLIIYLSTKYIHILIYLFNLKVSAKKDDLKNYFENPFDASKKVYIFSDAPHLLKNIRNRLFQNKTLIVNIKIIYNLSFINNQMYNENY